MKKRLFDLSGQNKSGKLKAVFFSALIAGSLFANGLTVNADSEGYITPDIEIGDSDVTRIYVHTAEGNGNSLERADGYTDAEIKVVTPEGTLTDPNGNIKVRGHTTARGEKKPFTLKFSAKQNLFNVEGGGAKKWALLANSFDPTLIRNTVAFELAEELGLSYTPNHQFVEFYLDDVFKGCYELTDPIEAKNGRIDITTKGTKDFLVQYESSRVDETATYIKPDDYRFEVKEPEEPTAEQTAYIENTMDDIIQVIKTLDYEQIKQRIDVDSFAAYYLLNEFYKTVDFNYSSIYYYYKNGILYAGPTWDYDLSTGNTFSSNSRKLSPMGQDANVQLFTHLCRCREFMYRVREIYVEHYDYMTNIYSDGGLIDQLASENKEIFARNYSTAGWDIKKLYSPLMRKPDTTYDENVAYLKNWLSERNDWMTEHYCVFDENFADNYPNNLMAIPFVYYEPGPGKVTLRWSGVSYAQKYCVVAYIRGNWRLINIGYTNTYEIDNLKGGEEYTVAVLTMIDGVWNRDYSNAITIVADDIRTKYPNIRGVMYNKDFHQFKLRWSTVRNTEQYAVAVKMAGKWKVMATTSENYMTSPKLRAGMPCEIVVCAKVKGKWDLTNINSRAVRIVVP